MPSIRLDLKVRRRDCAGRFRGSDRGITASPARRASAEAELGDNRRYGVPILNQLVYGLPQLNGVAGWIRYSGNPPESSF